MPGAFPDISGNGGPGHGDDAEPDGVDSVPETDLPDAPLLCVEPAAGVGLCLTEVQSRNDSTLADPAGAFDDWIEITHVGTVSLARERIEIRTDDDDWVQLSGDDILPGDTMLLWANGLSGPDQLPFAISKDGERIELRVDGQLSDVLDVPELPRDTSFARTETTGEAVVTCTPSPGVPNPAPYPCSDPREWVFALGQVHTFNLTLDSEAWATLESSSTFDHPKAMATLEFEGGQFPLVEINIKGGYGSFRNNLDTDKVGFRLDLDEFADHRWRGLEHLTFNNMVQDPTFTHEYLTYALYRELGLAAPRVAYTHLYVNGVYFGAYAIIETVDDTLLEDWYGDGNGHMFEGAYGNDFDSPGDEDGFNYDRGPNESEGRGMLRQIIDTLDQPWDDATFADLDLLVDMDQWMTNMAVEAAVWHWDGYWTENNYRMYRSPDTGRWQIIPHGTDQTWVDGYPGPFQSSSQPILYDFCMHVPDCASMYADKLREVADAIDAPQLTATLDALVALTEPLAAGDPRAEQQGERSGQISGTYSRIDSAPEDLRNAAG